MVQVIETYCDQCAERGENIPAEVYGAAISLPGQKPEAHETDLCEQCAKPLLDLLEELRDKGRPVKRRKSGPAAKPRAAVAAVAGPEESAQSGGPASALACPVAGCEFVGTSAKQLSGHVRRHHDTTLAEARGDALPYRCDVCGRGFARPQSVALHRMKGHPEVEERPVSELRVS